MQRNTLRNLLFGVICISVAAAVWSCGGGEKTPPASGAYDFTLKDLQGQLGRGCCMGSCTMKIALYRGHW